MNLSGKEVVCTWPNGDVRQCVCMVDTGGDKVKIIWNESVESQDKKLPYKTVTGFDEMVPRSWLQLKSENLDFYSGTN